MLVEVIHEQLDEGYDEVLIILIDGVEFCRYDNEYVVYIPEDIILCRLLSFMYNIPELLQKVYDSALKGEKLEIIHRVVMTE